VDGAEITTAIVEVISVNTKKIASTVGTYVIVGVASAVGSALWTYVLRDKVSYAIWKLKRPKADNVIDFRKEVKRLSR
jgi:hypothetical protein